MVGGVGLPNYFFLLSFFLSGQVMVLVSSGFVHGMSPRGGPALGSGGLGGGFGGLGGGLGGLGGFSRTMQHTLLHELPYGVTGGGCASAQRGAKRQPLGDGGERAGGRPCHSTRVGLQSACGLGAGVLVASSVDLASAQEV